MAENINKIEKITSWNNLRLEELTISPLGNTHMYHLSAKTVTGHERLWTSFLTNKNKDYKISVRIELEKYHNDYYDYNNQYITVSSNMIDDDAPTDLISSKNKASILAQKRIYPVDDSYSLEFNSKDNTVVYICIDFDDLYDNKLFSMDIEVNTYHNNSPDYLIESAYKTGYYFKDGEKIDTFIYMVLIRDEDILEILPQEITPGSWAYTAAGKKVWQMDFDREWIPAFDEDE